MRFSNLVMKNKQEIHLQLQSIFSSIMPTYGKNYWLEHTELFGALPEFDSMAIVSLIGEIEDCFDLDLDDDVITAENFATVGTVVDLVLKS